MASKVFVAASLLAIAYAQGPGAVVSNNCGFDVYYKPKGVPGTTISTQTFSSGDQPLNFPYPPQGGAGWNVIFSPDSTSVDNEDNVSQLEVTFSDSNAWTPAQIWYDVSNVNSSFAGMAKAVTTYPFAQWGFTLSSSQSDCGGANNCEPCGCAAGVHDCKDAYQYWNDDANAMHDTTSDSSVHLELCKSFGSGATPDSGSSGSSGSDSGSDSGSGSGDSGYSSSSDSYVPETAPTSSVSFAEYSSAAPSSAQQTTFATSYAAASSPAAYTTPAPSPSYMQAADFHHDAPSASEADSNEVTVTDVVNAAVTDYVTATAGARMHRRHEHVHGHAHRHHQA